MATPKTGLGGNLRNLYDKARQLVSDDRPPRFPTPTAPMNPPALPIPLSLMSMEHQEELELLLKPIAEDMPCGPALRYDPIFTEIRLAREEDDPSLPMGEWERPLKRADWPLIESRCKAMLGSRSKDLQIAVWLLEAWTRQYAFDGLYRGLSLVDRLVRQFWEPLHPQIQDDDIDVRIAPLEWLNGAFAVSVRLHMPLLKVSNRKPPGLTLADWESMTARELAAGGHVPDSAQAEAPMTRQEVIGYAQQRLGRELALKQQILRRCLNCLETMLAFLDLQLGAQSPNLSKLKAVLVAIERVLAQLLPEQKEEEMTIGEDPRETREQDGALVAGEAEPVVALSGWKNRHEAYATLGAIADYLSLVEPHSPTPYLLRRAVNWGRMPLPELMAEIIREEGDLNRLVNMLGLKE